MTLATFTITVEVPYQASIWRTAELVNQAATELRGEVSVKQAPLRDHDDGLEWVRCKQCGVNGQQTFQNPDANLCLECTVKRMDQTIYSAYIWDWNAPGDKVVAIVQGTLDQLLNLREFTGDDVSVDLSCGR